jgi:hypothetical protein
VHRGAPRPPGLAGCIRSTTYHIQVYQAARRWRGPAGGTPGSGHWRRPRRPRIGSAGRAAGDSAGPAGPARPPGIAAAWSAGRPRRPAAAQVPAGSALPRDLATLADRDNVLTIVVIILVAGLFPAPRDTANVIRLRSRGVLADLWPASERRPPRRSARRTARTSCKLQRPHPHCHCHRGCLTPHRARQIRPARSRSGSMTSDAASMTFHSLLSVRVPRTGSR